MLFSLLLVTLAVANLPRLVTVANQPSFAEAIVVLGGDSDGSRLRRGLQLQAGQPGARLILVAGSRQSWVYVTQKLCPDCNLEGGGRSSSKVPLMPAPMPN